MTGQGDAAGDVTTATISFAAMVDQAETGDVLLFSGDSEISRIVEMLSLSFYSHTAMVIEVDGKKYVWQAAGEVLYPDPLAGKPHAGAQLGAIELVIPYLAQLHDAPTFRKLTIDRDDAFRESFVRIATEHNGRPFCTFPELAYFYVGGRYFGDSFVDRSVFCSLLVALTFQRTGLMSTEHPANYYNPGDFSALGEARLVTGALGPNLTVDMSGVAPVPPPSGS